MSEDKKQPQSSNTEQSNVQAPNKRLSKKALEATCEEYLQGWKRALADYENLKRNLSSEKTRERESVRIEFATSLLPVMDNFDQAVKFAPESDSATVQNWLSGVTFIQKQFEQVFEGLGIEQVKSVGELFDTSLHESVGEREEEGKKEGEILELVTTGWRLGDRLIRPAKVIVAKGA
ncbi:MAG: nucleotide exchange factor GrpE [bacterium]|nr:nucleotide exchange factor GrpE [bacterium]MDA1024411.1 nucleotide exchange factor GrpE [bacterium]